VEFLGRVDEQVKIRGFRVEPAEIESTLRRHRGVRNAVVLPVAAKDDRDAERRLFAFVIAAEDHRVTAAELREYLSDRLPHYMVPAGFVLVDRFASTPGGKIDRLALARRADPSRASEENYMAPRTSTEVELAGIWSELLGLPRIGIHDDFFALGGHSLLAARALARVRSRFQVELSLRELFLHPTIAGVAQATDLALATGKSAPMTELDLERETELDDSIGADGGVFQFPAQPARVFLTGATGFVGAFLLRELLDEMDAEVYCLVRAVSPDDGARKLRGSLEKYGLWEETTGARIVAVPGDLSEPGLGLSDEQFAVLGRDVEVIYHNGAWVNTLYPYPMLKAANVEGTREVLRLACHRRIKPVHYVSTLSVFPAERWTSGVMEERWNVDGGNSLHGGYAQSKWVAERLVSKAAARGIPVSTYRLGRVSGDSRTGVWLPDPVLIDFLQTLLDVGSLPRLDDDSPVDLIPVDYVTRAMVHLSRQSESLGKIFHLVNPEPLVWREFIDRVRGLRSPLRELTPEQWGAEVLRFARRNPDSFLHPLVPLLPSDVAARLDSAGEPAPERIAPARSGAAVPRLRVDCANTLQGLKDSGLACPPAGALLEMYFSYFVRSGMLKIRA
jgi:thioester reductase-like protein